MKTAHTEMRIRKYNLLLYVNLLICALWSRSCVGDAIVTWSDPIKTSLNLLSSIIIFFLPDSSIFHAMGWRASIHLFFQSTFQRANFKTEHKHSSRRRTHIFSVVSPKTQCFVILFSHLSFLKPSTQKDTNMKQLWLNAAGTIILSRTTGIEKLISL